MKRWILAVLAAANTWYLGWVFTALSFIPWAMAAFGLDAAWNGSSHRPDNYGPLLWAGFPAMCTGFCLSIWGTLKIGKKTKPWQRPARPAAGDAGASERVPVQGTAGAVEAPSLAQRAQSFGFVALFVIVAQSICFAPCVLQPNAASLVSEWVVFPLLCAGFSGYAVLQSHTESKKAVEEAA